MLKIGYLLNVLLFPKLQINKMQLLYGNSCMMNDFYKKELQCCVYSNEYYNSVSNRSIKKSTLHKLLLNEMAKHRTITGLAKGFFLHKRCNSIAKVTKNSVANKTMLFFLSFWVNSYIVAKIKEVHDMAKDSLLPHPRLQN